MSKQKNRETLEREIGIHVDIISRDHGHHLSQNQRALAIELALQNCWGDTTPEQAEQAAKQALQNVLNNSLGGAQPV